MADLILQNNIRWDWALLKQIQLYKRDGTVSKLADKNFTEIASTVTLEPGKITFTNKDKIYEIVPYEDILEQLDSIMADPALAVQGQYCLYKRIQALNLRGISWPSAMEYLNKDMVHQTHQCIQQLKVQKPVIALSKLDQLEVDLIDMSKWGRSNNSRRYAVSITDCFSKYAWLLPITQKKMEKVLEVLGPFLKEHTPMVLQSDYDGEFTKVQQQWASWPKIVDNYNNTYHTTIKSTPAAV